MLNLSLKKLKLIAKNRTINGYKRISKEYLNELLSIINISKPRKNNKKRGQKESF